MSARHKAYLFLTLTAAIWGFAGPIIKYTLIYFDPAIFLTYRFFITSVIFLPLLFILEPRTWHTLSSLTPHEWAILAFTSLLGSTIELGLIFWGFSLTSSIAGTMINSTSPILVALACVIFLKERVTRKEKIGLGLAFLGSIFIVLKPDSSQSSFLGNILVFLGSLTWVAYVLLTKRQLHLKLSPLLLSASMFFVGFVTMSIWVMLTHATFPTAPFSAHLGVVYMGLFSGGLAYYLYQRGQKTIEASEANVFLFLQPLFATPLAFFWLHEPISLVFIVGSLIITSGVALAQL